MTRSSQKSDLQEVRTEHLFSKQDFVARHPNLLTLSRVNWALRHRRDNGLDGVRGVYESLSGVLLIDEPAFLRWWLGLEGRAKPRSGPRARRSQVDRGANTGKVRQ